MRSDRQFSGLVALSESPDLASNGRPGLGASITEGRRRISRTTLIVIGLLASLAVGALLVFYPVAAVLFPAAVIYVLMVLERPAIGALAMAALVPITAGLARDLVIPGVKLPEVLIVGTALLILGTQEGRPRIGALDIAAIAYVLTTAIFTIWHPLFRAEPLTLDVARDAFAPAMFFLLYRSVRVAGLTSRQRATALGLMVVPSVLAVGFAVGQRLDVPGVRDLVAQVTGGDVFFTWSYLNTSVGARATGLFEVWHSFAGYLLPLLLVCVAVATEREVSRALKIGATSMGAIIVVGLLLSQTLTVIALAVPATVAVAVLRGAQPKGALLVAFLIGLGVFFAGDAVVERVEQQFGGPSGTTFGNNIDARLEIWSEDYAEPLGEYWAFGYGPGIPPGVEWQSTESGYITLLLRGGILLLATYLIFYLLILDEAWYARRSGFAVDRIVGDVLLVLVPTTMLMSLIWPYFTSAGFPQVLWLLVGLLPMSSAGERARALTTTPSEQWSGQQATGTRE